ncbi:hypothetical protein WMY93_023710 [Mugilogobius chulae]|uniref:Protein Wnt n=1 Tax=Mugilogobius chulae TaxID=88201 RepID=A0AAW0N9H7_9GOBI
MSLDAQGDRRERRRGNKDRRRQRERERKQGDKERGSEREDARAEVWTLGTAGRVCNRTSRGVDGCDVMCCGRGYDTARVRLKSKCECKFHWCCSVLCQDCDREEDMHFCKGQT